MKDIKEELQRLQEEALLDLANVNSSNSLEAFRVKYLGRKGVFSSFMKLLGELSAKEKPLVGKLANETKDTIGKEYEQKKALLDSVAPSCSAPPEDLSLPGRYLPFGRLHPLTQVMEEVCSIFEGLGFSVAEGPDIELDFYNFEALNIPPHHPARDMHDTFYIDENVLLRTHTSPMQVRAMLDKKPPLRMIAPGKVYRCDSDITHTPMFHQVEGFLVDQFVSFAELKGVLTVFIKKMFDEKTPIRFRPSFFPFTEPSAEVDIGCVICSGSGCRVCKQTGWLEILGAGMIDPEVFRMVRYDPEKYSGFAFGLGIERIAMLRYGINDIRLYYENDLRFLEQF